MNKDQRILDILSKFGEDLSSTWMVQGQRVIRHAALERIATRAGISFDKPFIVRSEEREAVILVYGRMGYGTDTNPNIGERFEWSVGEANMALNYRTSEKQPAYPYAMAEKRAKDRVILKLIQLHGLLYSEEEADEFKGEREEAIEAGAATARGIIRNLTGEEPSPKDARHEVMSDAIMSGKPIQLDDGEVHPGESLKRKIQEQGTAIGVKNLMLRHEVQTYLSSLPEDQRNELRDYAKCRMVALGWKKERRAAKEGQPNG